MSFFGGKIVDFPFTAAKFETVTHSAAISQTTLYTTPSAGFYRVDAIGSCITVGTGAGQTWDLDLEYTNGATQTAANFLNAVDGLTAGSLKTGTQLMYLPAGATIKYTTNSNGTVTTAAVIAICVVVTSL